MKKLSYYLLAIGLAVSVVVAACAPAAAPTPAPTPTTALAPAAPAATPTPAPAAKPAAPTKAAWETKWEEVVTAGKAEGKVMIYGAISPENLRDLSQAFTAKYGITLELVSLPQGAAMATRLDTERGAGLYVADVIIHGLGSGVNLLKPKGIVDPLEPVLILPEVTDPNVWRPGYSFLDQDKTLKPIRASLDRFLWRNTNMVKEGELTSYRDLLDPKWKGKIVMGDPSTPGAAAVWASLLIGTWGRDAAVRYFQDFLKQEPVVNRDIRVPMESVARGSYPVGVGIRPEAFPEFLAAGAPVALVDTTEGGVLGPQAGVLSVVNKRPHPNATQVFVNWLLSKEGMTVWSKTDGYPTARNDIPTDWVDKVFLIRPDAKFQVDNEQAAKERGESMKLAGEIFAPILR